MVLPVLSNGGGFFIWVDGLRGRRQPEAWSPLIRFCPGLMLKKCPRLVRPRAIGGCTVRGAGVV